MQNVTLDDVQNLRFPPARRAGEGYDTAAVDAVFAGIVEAMRSGEDATELARAARFPILRVPGGYRATEVDDLLDRIQGDLPAPAHETGAGLWARLFGRG